MNALLACLGNFNAVLGTDRYDSHSAVGPFGSVEADDNTDRLVCLCVANGLRICGSWYET